MVMLVLTVLLVSSACLARNVMLMVHAMHAMHATWHICIQYISVMILAVAGSAWYTQLPSSV